MPFQVTTSCATVVGGVPIIADGKIIGAVGVSGATAQQDGQVAKIGADTAAGK
jgi:uncharacterized protein GlcG (DUF336 family)